MKAPSPTTRNTIPPRRQSPRSDKYREIEPYRGGGSKACLDALMKLVDGRMLAKSRNGGGMQVVSKRDSEDMLQSDGTLDAAEHLDRPERKNKGARRNR